MSGGGEGEEEEEEKKRRRRRGGGGGGGRGGGGVFMFNILFSLVYPCYVFFFIVGTGKYPLFLRWIHGTPSTT
jgi:hypothetical protein